MTTFEHALLGVNGALAAGLHRQHGYQIVALAGFAAVVPDWDGLTIVFSKSAFATGHRVWGHNVLACVLAGVIVGLIDYRVDLMTRGGRLIGKLCRPITNEEFQPRHCFALTEMALWVLVAVVAAFSHLGADLVVSGSATLPDWKLKLLWPFSEREWIYPLVSWGDVGITLIFVTGMFAMLKWRSHARTIATVTLLLVVVYIAFRGVLGR